MSDKYYVGLDITSFSDNGKYKPISRVTLFVDDDNSITAGDDTGLEISASCPHATQEMVNSLLANLKGYQYQAYNAEAANIDPAAELGDGVTLGGLYSSISKISDDGFGYSGISAPGETEIDEEFPDEGPGMQEITRKFTETRSLISKTAEEIRLEVSNEISGLSSSISVKLDSITSTVNGLDGEVTSLKQTSSSLESTVQGLNGEVSSITQTLEGVAFKSGLADGTTTINGGCITTGKILASYIKLGGYMDLYESLDSDDDTLAGRFGKTTITINGNAFDATGISSNGNVFIGGAGYGFIATESNLEAYAGGNIILHAPSYSGVLTYGKVLAFNDTSIAYSGSDRRLKENINYDVNSKMISLFDALKPVSFRMKNDIKENQDHVGFVAQDVVAAVEESGLGNALIAVDSNGFYALNYGELTAVLTAKIKQLESRLEELEKA